MSKQKEHAFGNNKLHYRNTEMHKSLCLSLQLTKLENQQTESLAAATFAISAKW